MKIRTFPAVVVLASVLWVLFSCSDGGSTGSDTNDPTDPTQNASDFLIFLDDVPFTGDGVIRLEVEGSMGYEYIDIGTVKKGKGTIDFSKSISNDYLESMGNAPDGITVSPKNVKLLDGTFYVISGDKAYSLVQMNEQDHTATGINYSYFSQAVTIKGTAEQCNSYNICYTLKYDVDAKQGWNTIFVAATESTDKVSAIYSSDPSIVDLKKIKWTMDYEGSAEYYGGCDGDCPQEPDNGYCVFHSAEQCIYMNYIHQYGDGATCSGVGGVHMTYCPYEDEPEPDTSYCVDDENEECILMQDIDYPCSEWNGVTKDYCPAGYYMY